ncbi:MAG: copper chaperone PCu(A)C [Pseudomonadota bacterium]
MNRLILVVAAICAGTSALAHDFKTGALVVDHPMAFPTAATAQAGAGYFSVTNTGSEDDRLIGIQADFPKVSMHGTRKEDGVMSMFEVEAIDIPAGETVALEPGALHVMFMGLGGDPFEVGETIPATLTFENAGDVDVVFYVEPRGDGSEAIDHSAHQ